MIKSLISKTVKLMSKKKTVLMHGIQIIALLVLLLVPAQLGAASSGPASGAPPGWIAHNPIIIVQPPANNGMAPFTIPGLYPAKLCKAYGIDLLSNSGAGKTIAIVDAYGDPTITADLAAFNSQFGLPSSTLTIAYPGGTPGTDSGWAVETALDVEWAHAVAPAANILLVVAYSAYDTDLLTAVDYATSHGANVISMSWGGDEFSSETSYDSHFSSTGITYLASSGDNGEGVSWPAVSPYVIAVGGTTLNVDSSGNYISESA